MKHRGRCHCGAIRIAFETDKPLSPRACQCGFCGRHGARSVSDPEGEATLAFSVDPLRYRFATRAADYLVCSRCGVYVGAMTEQPPLVTLNLNAFDDPRPELEAAPVSYDGESAAAKAVRRRRNWTPVRLL